MASKRLPPQDDPPSAASDDDDETDDEQEQEIITQKTIQQSSSESEDEEGESESEEQTLPPEKNPQIQNPNSKSSEDESEEEESESEEQTPPLGKNPQIQNPNSKSSEESESESESEEETQAQTQTQTQTPTQTPKSSSIFEFESDIKSPSVSNLAIKPSNKINTFSTPEKKQVLKRPSLNTDLKNKKKVKVSNGDENKSSVIKRIWSEEDELMILQGFIDYQSKKGYSPLSDMDDFYQFTMDSLPGNASKSQLYEKVRRLKKKFRVNEEKVSTNGEDPVFVKPHECKLFEVSKKIWGINGCETVGNVNGLNAKTKARSVKPKPKAEVKVDAKVEKAAEVVDDEIKDFETLYPYWNAGLNLGVSPYLNFPKSIVVLFREDLSLIEEAKAKEMNEKWKAHFENEAMLRKRKFALLSKVSDVETM